MLRRLHPDQPDSFAFTEANQRWAEAQITKYPDGRQASAIIALLWRAQEQEGWLTRAAIEHVAAMLDMAYIRALEVATFYFMFQLQPVGSVAHVQVCGTTSCMICGAEDLIAVCRDKIAVRPHALSEDGRFSWEEVECLGACANAPMVQIGKDYYEDLTAESFAEMLDQFAAGEVPVPGSRKGRFSSEPEGGKTVLAKDRVNDANASVALARDMGDTIKRIDGTEAPLRAPWNPVMDSAAKVPPPVNDDLLGPRGGISEPTPGPTPAADSPVDGEHIYKQEPDGFDDAARPDEGTVAGEAQGDALRDGHHPAGETVPAGADSREGSLHAGAGPLSGGAPSASADETNAQADAVAEGGEVKPAALDAPDGAVDDLKEIKGIGPKLEDMLNGMGIYHFRQIAGWSARELAWVDRNLDGFKGRAVRDNWVGQARALL